MTTSVRVGVVPGDDAAPDAVHATLDVVQAMALPVDWVVVDDPDELHAGFLADMEVENEQHALREDVREHMLQKQSAPDTASTQETASAENAVPASHGEAPESTSRAKKAQTKSHAKPAKKPAKPAAKGKAAKPSSGGKKK